MERQKRIVRTSYLGIIVNLFLVIFKACVGLIANSIAIVLDAVNNLTDVLSSVITIIGTKLANKKPDKEHPYGHGRIEYFTSLIISLIILWAGIIAGKESIEKIINPEIANYSIISLIIIVIAVMTKVILSKYVKNVGKEVNSKTLIASGQDAFMDAILSFTTLVAAIINYVWHLNLEGYLGILISLFIIKAAYELLKETTNSMLGERADKDLTDKIKRKISTYKEVQGVYDLSLHNYGPSKIIGTVHIQVRNNLTAEEIHILTRGIVIDLYNDFGIYMTIGIYAANDSGEYLNIRNEINKIIKEYKHILQFHGFYVDKKTNNVYFDIIIDFEANNSEKIRNEIIAKLESAFPEYKFNVFLDADVSDL